MLIQLDACYQKDPSIVYRNIGDEAILVPVRRRTVDLDCIYTLNETGATIWQLLDGKRTLSEIADLMVYEYDVSRDVARADVLEFVQQVESFGGIVRIE